MALFDRGLGQLRNLGASADAVPTQGLLEVCNLVLEAVDQLGTGFMLVRSDVGGNIKRLATRAATDPAKYQPNVFAMVTGEVAAGEAGGSSSCTKGLLWLKRAMQFVTALLLRLTQDREVPLSTAASETYYATLHQYHGWLVTGTFTVALKLVPSRESFLAAVGADTEAGLRSMAAFAEEFGSLLAVLHAFLDARGLDDPTKV